MRHGAELGRSPGHREDDDSPPGDIEAAEARPKPAEEEQKVELDDHDADHGADERRPHADEPLFHGDERTGPLEIGVVAFVESLDIVDAVHEEVDHAGFDAVQG